jgi:hypothetical protein
MHIEKKLFEFKVDKKEKITRIGDAFNLRHSLQLFNICRCYGPTSHLNKAVYRS